MRDKSLVSLCGGALLHFNKSF